MRRKEAAGISFFSSRHSSCKFFVFVLFLKEEERILNHKIRGK